MSGEDPVLPPGLRDARGWLARRDARLRVVAAVAFALVTLSLWTFTPLVVAMGFALLLALAGGQSWRHLGRRLILMGGFLALLLLTLPFTVPGEPLLTLGPLVASAAGLERALMVLLKANAVVLALLGLVGGLEPVVLGHALARLGVPDKLVHLFLQTVRQIHLLGQEYRRLRQAMRARAFAPRSDRHTWSSYGWLIGMLLVRSLARSRRVLAAMRCRGFQGRLYLLGSPRWTGGDSLFAASLGLVLVALLALGPLA